MRNRISFHKADIQFRFLSRQPLTNWINSIIKKENRTPGEITYVFCSDKYLLNLNRKFLNHDYYTDIITFDNTIGTVISGEIYISIDRVRENASGLKIGFQKELQRVIIHGVLHLLGYSDTTKTQKLAMRLKEDTCLSLFPSFT